MDKSTKLNGNNQSNGLPLSKNEQKDDYFITRTIKQVIEDGSKIEERKKIYGCFLYQDTNTFIFSRSNMGKTLLAFDIGFIAATGMSKEENSALQNESKPITVLYYDNELDERDIFDRHEITKDTLPKEFENNFIYLHNNPEKTTIYGLEALKLIEEKAIKHKAKLIIIDNLTKLIPENIDGKLISQLISAMQRIRAKTGASFLVIGHKRTCIKPEDYYGSAFIEAFFFEVFYLDETNDQRFFLRQSKTKKKEKYEDVVPVFTRGDHPILGSGFTFEELRNHEEVKKPDIITHNSKRQFPVTNFAKQIEVLVKMGEKKTTIANMCNVHRSVITRILNGS
jgi:hypothetical protein